MKIKFLTLAALAILFTSCEKDDKPTTEDPKVDKEAPVITFLAPDTTSYMSGMTMPIKFTVTDNDELHEIHLSVTNITDAKELLHFEMHQHGQSATIDTSLVIPAGGMHREFEIKAEASDHNGNESEKSITKHIHM